MTNIVDTSPETIETEFDEAAKALGMDDANTTQAETEQPESVMDEAQRQAEIEMAKSMIANALRFSVRGIVKVEIDEALYTETAEAYAVLIIRYFPGGLFALLDRYKEEIAAGAATFVLIKTVREAKAIKLAEAEEEQQRKQNTKPKPENTRFDLNNENTGARDANAH